MSELNLRQEAFCQEYLIDFNGQQAAIRAGYSKRAAGTQATVLLKHPGVASKLAQLIDERGKRTQVTADAVISEIAKVAFSNSLDYIKVGDDGLPYVDLTTLTRDQAAAILSAEVHEYKEGRGEDARLILATKIKFHPKLQALEMLAKHFGLFKDALADYLAKNERPLVMVLPDNGSDSQSS